MKSNQYKLDGHTPVPCTVMEWAMWMDEHRNNRNVQTTTLPDGTWVSTVFLGLDHSFKDDAEPVLFETMIFGGDLDQYQWRYSTWEEDEAGHARALKLIEREKKWYMQLYRIYQELFNNFQKWWRS